MTPDPRPPGEAPPLPPPPSPSIAPYYPPPYPPPAPHHPPARTDSKAVASLLCGILGLVLFVLGIPAMILGPVAYFMGRRAERRIAESRGVLAGHAAAYAGWLIGVIATAFGAAALLFWFVLLLLQVASPTI